MNLHSGSNYLSRSDDVEFEQLVTCLRTSIQVLEDNTALRAEIDYRNCEEARNELVPLSLEQVQTHVLLNGLYSYGNFVHPRMWKPHNHGKRIDTAPSYKNRTSVNVVPQPDISLWEVRRWPMKLFLKIRYRV